MRPPQALSGHRSSACPEQESTLLSEVADTLGAEHGHHPHASSLPPVHLPPQVNQYCLLLTAAARVLGVGWVWGWREAVELSGFASALAGTGEWVAQAVCRTALQECRVSHAPLISSLCQAHQSALMATPRLLVLLHVCCEPQAASDWRCLLCWPPALAWQTPCRCARLACCCTPCAPFAQNGKLFPGRAGRLGRSAIHHPAA